MCLQKLPTAARDVLLRPEDLVGGLAIREATAEVASRGCRHSESRRTRRLLVWLPLAIAALRYSGPKPKRAKVSARGRLAISH